MYWHVGTFSPSRTDELHVVRARNRGLRNLFTKCSYTRPRRREATDCPTKERPGKEKKRMYELVVVVERGRYSSVQESTCRNRVRPFPSTQSVLWFVHTSTIAAAASAASSDSFAAVAEEEATRVKTEEEATTAAAAVVRQCAEAELQHGGARGRNVDQADR